MKQKRGTDGSNSHASRRRRRAPARGILWLVALMLSASGILRFSGEGGQAIAREVSAAMASTGEETGGVDAGKSQKCNPPPDVAIVLEHLNKRARKLDVREAALLDRQAEIKAAETAIKLELDRLKAAEAGLRETVTIADKAAEKDIERLTAVYENMKPDEAAPLFAQMAPEFAAGFLARMRPDASAAIMAGLEPKVAYHISVVLAGRNANAPKN